MSSALHKIFIYTTLVLLFLAQSVYSLDKTYMDVVLVMDSSGSMKKTDPDSLRIPAAKLFISLLEEGDRAGVVSFSDKSYPIVYLTPVDNDEDRDRLFRATERVSSKGVYTNLYDALDGGHSVLMADSPGNETKVIVLMSDGMMDLGDPELDREMRAGINNGLTKKLNDDKVRVYTIAFTESSDRELLEDISKRTDGFYNLAISDKDLHLIFTSIFESLKTPDMLPMSKNSFMIDSSIEEVTVVATKASPDTTIKLNSPDGASYSVRDKNLNIDWFSSDSFEMITVQKPAEGKWEILFSTGENNKAYVITNLKIMSNFDQLEPAFGEPLNIEIWLEKDGSPITDESVLGAIDMEIELLGPDQKVVSLKPFDKGDGHFLRRLEPFSEGNHTLSIVAKGKTFERKKEYLFNITAPEKPVEETSEPVKEEQPEAVEEKEEPLIAEKAEEEGEQTWQELMAPFAIFNLVLGVIIFGIVKIVQKRKKKDSDDEDDEDEDDDLDEESEPDEDSEEEEVADLDEEDIKETPPEEEEIEEIVKQKEDPEETVEAPEIDEAPEEAPPEEEKVEISLDDLEIDEMIQNNRPDDNQEEIKEEEEEGSEDLSSVNELPVKEETDTEKEDATTDDKGTDKTGGSDQDAVDDILAGITGDEQDEVEVKGEAALDDAEIDNIIDTVQSGDKEQPETPEEDIKREAKVDETPVEENIEVDRENIKEESVQDDEQLKQEEGQDG